MMIWSPQLLRPLSQGDVRNQGKASSRRLSKFPYTCHQLIKCHWDFCFRGVNDAIDSSGISITKEQADAFVRHFVDGIEPRLKTPRMCKRYANALIFALPILKDEVNHVDLMLIEGVRVFYPALYKFIRKNRDLFAGTISTRQYDQQKNKEIEVRKIDGALEEFGKDAIHAKTLLMTLFPKLKGLYGNMHYGSDWEKNGLTRKGFHQRIISIGI